MRTSTRRPRPAVEDAALADRIGSRLKQARLKAGLTQQQLAADRYTKAYVSALENGLVRPSMSALTFFAERLQVPPSRLLGDETPAWTRLEADIHLAAGRWSEAAEAYTDLLDSATERGSRAELLRGRAEANARLDNALPAAADAVEAVRLFNDLGRESDAALATYWLAYAQFKQDNLDEARSLMRRVLDRVRDGLQVEPDFNLRLLLALSSIEAHDGEHARALAYLQEVRGLADLLDDRRRATEAAIRTGLQSLALYRASGAEFEMAALENNLALSFLANGNLGRASELISSSRDRFQRLHDEGWLAHVEDTAARIAIAEGDPQTALRLTETAIRIAERTGSQRALATALVTRANAQFGLGDVEGALASCEQAAGLVRESGPRSLLRDILGQWAELLAKNGRLDQAYALTREALAAN
jgi:tetratricopeptide (TPR) repeat protein